MGAEQANGVERGMTRGHRHVIRAKHDVGVEFGGDSAQFQRRLDALAAEV